MNCPECQTKKVFNVKTVICCVRCYKVISQNDDTNKLCTRCCPKKNISKREDVDFSKSITKKISQSKNGFRVIK